MGKVLITRDADYKGFNIEAEGGKFSVKNVMSGRMSVHSTYEEAKQEIDRIAKARTKDQSAEQEVAELGKQMKKMTAKDADYTVGPTSATIAKFSNKFTVVLRDQNGQGKRTKTVKVQGFKLDERDALREAEARNPGWGVKTITLDASVMSPSEVKIRGSYGRQGIEGYAAHNENFTQEDVRALEAWIKSRANDPGFKSYVEMAAIEVQAMKKALAMKVRAKMSGDKAATKDCSGTKDCGCGCTKDEMFTPYDSELKKHAAGAQTRKVDAPKPKGRNIHIWLHGTNDADRPFGQRVKILGGMAEFVGKVGTISGREGNMYRVAFQPPVDVPGVGPVRSDLWEARFLKTVG